MANEQRDQSNEAAVSPKDPVTGQLKSQPGPMERAGTEAEEAARGNTASGEDKRQAEDDRSA
ncbi:hypothetical protein MPAR168_14060 [Methylorubrum populi]|uniref:Uncharacterized protein n=1 Tax=Methylobacterium radiotolerans TaxID=31998 RepID=A0ABU7T9Y7_9HYPH|nr:hypothetical protein [Methylobacterium sp. B4]PXW59860.1 hypothetical protein BY998_11078 [Methylobacterium sp. B4]